MLDAQQLKAEDLQGLDAEAAAKVMAMVQRLTRELHLKETKLNKLTFELARLKALKFGAKTEAMDAEQRRLFEETLAEDEAGLRAQLEALQNAKAAAEAAAAGQDKQAPKRKPKRQPLPAHLRREDHRHEPEDTNCPQPECGKPMQRIGEDVSERLDIIPAEFFVHRHIYGKWACRCCQTLVQEPAAPQVIDKGQPTAGLVAHTLVSRFVDHVPYYRQEAINARSGVHTPRSTLAAWSGAGGAALEPLYEVHKAFVLACAVLHADETPVAMLDPGAGKTKKAYVWGYARSEFDPQPGVIYEFCAGRGGKYPVAFLEGWNGTLICDDYKGYETLFKLGQRVEAGCAVHSRRKFDELIKHGHSEVATEAVRRMAVVFKIEQQIRHCDAAQRLALRQQITRPHWDALHAWLRLERQRVPDGSAIANALDYSLRRWEALSCFLHDGHVSPHNNHLENLLRPWAVGRKAWLFAGSELAGQRAAMVMSLVQSAKLNGHDPWAYLKDVLERLPGHPASRIEELLPHRWKAGIER
jgi:transposase